MTNRNSGTNLPDSHPLGARGPGPGIPIRTVVMYAIICHMKRTTVFVDEALEHDLRAIAGRRGQPVASLVREALAAFVAGEKRGRRTTLSFVAAGASGRADTAERHEEIVFRPPNGRRPRSR
jgi:predicted transcriptional regulator